MLDYTVEEFINDVRTRIGDTSRSVSSAAIMGYLRTSLRRIARADGTEKLFERRETIDLANINKDGTPAASWDLGRLGTIIDIPHLRLLKASPSRIREITPAFLETRDFYMQFPVPEQNAPGDPCNFTIDQVGTNVTKLILDRPVKDLVSLDMWFSVFPTRITDPAEQFPVDYDFADIFEEYVIILHNIETTDQNNARALWEDLDVLTAELVEMLARRKKGLPYRRVKRSF